ncbi:hypothetical protein BDV97DRAFT_362246 [Delphinella strobiligena]|nr:hypothetical protein BDV97DRAFT_362246 [Delphinella strobiligena]
MIMIILITSSLVRLAHGTSHSTRAVCLKYTFRILKNLISRLTIKNLQCSGTSKSEQSFETRVRITCPHVPFGDG